MTASNFQAMQVKGPDNKVPAQKLDDVFIRSKAGFSFPKIRLAEVPAIISMVIIGLTLAAAVLAPWLPVPAPDLLNLKISLRSPGYHGDELHIFGTDNLGRDVLSRIIWGARITALVGVMAVLLSGSIGGLLGLISGYSRSGVGKLIMTVADIQMSIPPLILALGFIAVLGPGVANVVIVVALTGWPQYARIIRSEVLSLRERPYVQMAKVCGSSTTRIIARHILPNVFHTMIVIATLEVGRVIVFESSLSFLGLGIQPPAASWGSMLAEGRNYLSRAWWITVFPGLAIVLVVLSINILGDWLRDRFDPYRL